VAVFTLDSAGFNIIRGVKVDSRYIETLDCQTDASFPVITLEEDEKSKRPVNPS